MADRIAYPGTELEALAEAENYYRWIITRFHPWLHGDIVEVGAGLGTFAERLERTEPIASLTLFEPDRGLVGALEHRFAGSDRVRVRPTVFDPGVLTGPVDAIVLVNVLEHIERDSEFARQAWEALRPGGALLLFVPALPPLFGSLDRAFDHYRRYTRASMHGLLEGVGFQVQRLDYMNLPGVVSWFIAGRILRLRTIRPASMRLYDSLVIPWVSWIERRVAPPIGQNLLAVAVKPGRGRHPGAASGSGPEGG